jgi:hypothetical protein
MRAHQRLHDRQQNQRRGERPQEPQDELRGNFERRSLVAKRDADDKSQRYGPEDAQIKGRRAPPAEGAQAVGRPFRIL